MRSFTPPTKQAINNIYTLYRVFLATLTFVVHKFEAILSNNRSQIDSGNHLQFAL